MGLKIGALGSSSEVETGVEVGVEVETGVELEVGTFEDNTAEMDGTVPGLVPLGTEMTMRGPIGTGLLGGDGIRRSIVLRSSRLLKTSSQVIGNVPGNGVGISGSALMM